MPMFQTALQHLRDTDASHIPDRRQSKTLVLSKNVDQKSLKTEFLIAICRWTGDKWQSKTLFLVILDPRSSIVMSIFDCRRSGVIHCVQSCNLKIILFF